jgi:hypothetical protein
VTDAGYEYNFKFEMNSIACGIDNKRAYRCVDPAACFTTSPDTDKTEKIWKGIRYTPNPVTPSNRPGIYGQPYSATKNYMNNDTVCNREELTAWVCNRQNFCSSFPPSNANIQKDQIVWRYYNAPECIIQDVSAAVVKPPK